MKRLLAWLPALVWAGFIFFVSAQPRETFERLGLTGLLLSTLGHLVTYGILMFLVVLALHYGTSLSTRYLFATAFVLVALYGLTDEYHQSFVSGRTATLWDWLVDVVGAVMVWIILARRGIPEKWDRRTYRQQ